MKKMKICLSEKKSEVKTENKLIGIVCPHTECANSDDCEIGRAHV